MKYFRLLLILALSSFMYGCASPAQVSHMEIKDTTTMVFNKKFVKAIKLAPIGNISETYGMINADHFESALFLSLKQLDLIAINNKPRYELSVQFMSAEQPLFGIDFEVTSKIKYILIDKNSNKVIINNTILAPYTASFSDAWIAAKRLKLANEGTVRLNIMKFLEKLSSLK
jgi:hypothetical protein